MERPKKKGWFGSSRKKKLRPGSTRQSVASVSAGAVVPQNSMMEVFSRATKRLARTQSKLPHHSGLSLSNSMLPMALNATQVACSVMVLQATETDEEAERFVRRQASLPSAREVEGSSAQAESRAALLKESTYLTMLLSEDQCRTNSAAGAERHSGTSALRSRGAM